MSRQQDNSEKLERLMEIKEEMLELLREANSLLRDAPMYDRAKGYWIAHIRTALDKDHGYMGGSMCTFQDTIEEFEHYAYGDDEE